MLNEFLKQEINQAVDKACKDYFKTPDELKSVHKMLLEPESKMKHKEQKKQSDLTAELEQIIMDMGYRRAMCTPRAREIQKQLDKLAQK